MYYHYRRVYFGALESVLCREVILLLGVGRFLFEPKFQKGLVFGMSYHCLICKSSM